MNRRSNKMVPAFVGMLCLSLLAGQSLSAHAQSYEGYPVFWGKRGSLQRSTDGAKSEIRSARAGSSSIEQVAYTETKTAGGVVFEASSPEAIVEGKMIHEGEVIYEGGVISGGGCDDCGSCSGAGCGMCRGGCLEGAFQGLLSRSEWSFGMQSFKGPLDDGDNANFGLQQGFNIGFPLLPSYGIGAQIGANFTQSDLSGYTVQNFETRDARNQQFLTIGLFERATDCCPLQWGLVYDYMSDDIGGGKDLELNQLRGEIGYLFSETGELGFWFTTSDESDSTYYSGNKGFFSAVVEPTDLYAFYYRNTSCEGNELRMWAGFTGESDGLVGGDFQVPLSDRLALRGAANYLIPHEAKGYNGTREESWGMNVSLVWYPGCRARCVSSDLYAPLMRAADNTTFMVDNLNRVD
jgi:hypothetical protein